MSQELAFSEVTDASTSHPRELKKLYDNVESKEDFQLLIDEIDIDNVTAINSAFDSVYQDVPDTMAEGKILPPVVMTTSDNIEQELSITIPVSTPSGTIEQYTCLYGSDSPDPLVKLLVQVYTDSQNELVDLYGVHIPLIFENEEWKIHTARVSNQENSSLIQSFAIKYFPQLFKGGNNIVEFGKTYTNPEYKQKEMKPVTTDTLELTGSTDITITSENQKEIALN